MKIYNTIISIIFLLLFFSTSAFAQQPFTTDDANTTEKGKWHFEFSNEHDFLQKQNLPAKRQNTADFEIDFGLLKNVEIGIALPFLTIINTQDTTPRKVAGIGDANFSVKYNFLKEKENSKRPALALSFNLEMPTGSVSKGLGSGLSDFYLNGILQKSVTKKTTLRLNGGILFSGNDTTGIIGIKSRGYVYTGGLSLVKQFTDKLNLGVEITGAVQTNFQLGKGQLQTLIGGNYAFRPTMTFDFGVVAGRYIASPRAGVQLGVSIDF